MNNNSSCVLINENTNEKFIASEQSPNHILRSGATNTSLNSTALLKASNARHSDTYSLPKTAVNFLKMQKGLFNSKKDYPGFTKSDSKPSRNQ